MTERLSTHTRMNLQTAPILWAELERHFARGNVLQVAADLDLVAVAACMVDDDAAQLHSWLATQQVRLLPDDLAKCWAKQDSRHLWAVVVAPRVLVQERAKSS